MPSSTEVSTLSVVELHSLLGEASCSSGGAADDLVLIDCRDPDEYAICAIPQAVPWPLSAFATAFAERFPDRKRRIVVYCHHGMRSQRAVAQLRRKGYQNAASLEGGIDAWARQVEPTMRRY